MSGAIGKSRVANKRASPPRRGMLSPNTTPQNESLPKLPSSQIHRPDSVLFGGLDGLIKITGEPAWRLRKLMAMEFIDNAPDAYDVPSTSEQAAKAPHRKLKGTQQAPRTQPNRLRTVVLTARSR